METLNLMLNASYRDGLLNKILMPEMEANQIDFIPDNRLVMREVGDNALIWDIKRKVASYYNLVPDNTTRKREQVIYRQVCMYFMSMLTKKSTAQIGAEFGKDHATVIHSRNAVQDLIDTDKNFREDINILRNKFMI